MKTLLFPSICLLLVLSPLAQPRVVEEKDKMELTEAIKKLETQLMEEAMSQAKLKNKTLTEIMDETEAAAILDIMEDVKNEIEAEKAGDMDGKTVMEKRAKRQTERLSQIMSCLFTIFMNPGCVFGLVGGGGGGGILARVSAFLPLRAPDSAANAQADYNDQLRAWIRNQEAKIDEYNATQGYDYSTPFPVIPPRPPTIDPTPAPMRRGIFGWIRGLLSFIPRTIGVARDYLKALQPAVDLVRTVVRDRIDQARKGEGGFIGSILSRIPFLGTFLGASPASTDTSIESGVSDPADDDGTYVIALPGPDGLRFPSETRRR